MQKAVRLNILARNRSAKSSRDFRQRETKEAWKEWHQVTNRQKAINGSFAAEERLNRRQDWIAGPLAPNRNSGTQRGTYGTVDQGLTQLPQIPKSVRAGPTKEGYAIIPEPGLNGKQKGFRGKTIVGNVMEGDKVVIIAGPERIRGLTGYVNHVDLNKEEVKLRNINTVDVAYPSYAQPAANPNNPNPVKYTSVDVPIPMSHVRLVMPITDVGDVIIRHVHAGPPYEQREMGSNLPSHTRYATGIFNLVDPEGKSIDQKVAQDNSIETREVPLELPWPAANYPGKFEHFEGDTQRTALARPTWSVSLLGSPLGYRADVPQTVELGDSPYSRAPHLTTIDVKGTNGLQNIQRVGLDGFISYDRLVARREKIAAGILNELRDNRKAKPRFDDAEFVKRKLIEDARAIWYQERKLVTPQTQAVEIAVQNKAAKREHKIQEEMSERLDEIYKLAAKVQKLRAGSKKLTAQIMLRDGRGREVEAPKYVKFHPDKNLAKTALGPIISHVRQEKENAEELTRRVNLSVKRVERKEAEQEEPEAEDVEEMERVKAATELVLMKQQQLKAQKEMAKKAKNMTLERTKKEQIKQKEDMKRLGAKLKA